MNWARILALVTGMVDKELLARIEYLACKSASRIDPHRRPTWTHPHRHFNVVDEWRMSRHAGSALHADGGS